MAVSDSGELFTWGNGTRGCLGDLAPALGMEMALRC